MNEFLILLGLGAVSCAAPVPLVNPLEVVKTRLQLQSGAAAGGRKLGVVAMARHVVRTEGGWQALYKGVVPAVLREMSYAALRLALYDPLKRALGERRAGDSNDGSDALVELSWAAKLLCGSLSGAIGAAVATPTDVMKVRLQADASGTLYNRSFVTGVRTVFRSEGFRHGLYKGTTPTAGRAALLSAVFLPSYDQAKVVLKRTFGVDDSVPLHVTCGMFAGFCMSIVSSPVDVVKTRFVVSGPGAGSQAGLFQCIVGTARESGVRTFFKGFWPTFARLGPHTLMALAINEYLRKLCNIKPI